LNLGPLTLRRGAQLARLGELSSKAGLDLPAPLEQLDGLLMSSDLAERDRELCAGPLRPFPSPLELPDRVTEQRRGALLLPCAGMTDSQRAERVRVVHRSAGGLLGRLVEHLPRLRGLPSSEERVDDRDPDHGCRRAPDPAEALQGL
jgi:hypothetical protein